MPTCVCCCSTACLTLLLRHRTRALSLLALHQEWGHVVHGPHSSLPPYSVSGVEVDEEQDLANLSEGSSLDVPSCQAVLRYGTEILGDPALLHVAPFQPTDPPRDLVRIKQDKPPAASLRLASHRSPELRPPACLHVSAPAAQPI